MGGLLRRLEKRTPTRKAVVSTERRTLQLHGSEVTYVLRRSARRTLALHVGAAGVRVSVPLRTAEADIDVFLARNTAWLQDALLRLGACAPQPVVEIVDGLQLPLLGSAFRVRTGCAGRRVVWRAGADGLDELCLPASARNARQDVVRALRARALPWFAGRVEEYCHRLGLSSPPVRLSSARTRWGSCSARSGIRLHWRLIHLPRGLIDYVVAHEVAHLVEMNHSPRFWDVVESLYPDWRAARVALRDAGRALPVLEGLDRDAPSGTD